MKPISLTKRQKIVISAIILTLGLLFIQTADFFILRYRLVIFLSALGLILSIWSLWEGLTKQKAVILLILPTLFTLGVSSFYFLLPIRWLTRIPAAAIFCVSFYGLLLSQNVFNVSSSRAIPLYRAASTVAFIFTLITAFFLYNVIFALDFAFYINGLLVAIVSLPLILQIFWTVQMEKITPVIYVYSGVLSLLAGECALALSFWPLQPTIWSLLIATFIYCIVGITTEMFRDRMGKWTVFEYLGVGGLVLIFGVLLTSWTG